MNSYEEIRKEYLPKTVSFLLIAESPPPAADAQSSRHFYRTDRARDDDRLFINTIKALYPAETATKTEKELEADKKIWLRKFSQDGYFMIEALETSLPHEITKKERQALIRNALPRLLERISKLVGKHTKIILIKSNVFDVAAQPLREAGFTVLNNELLDYPGRFNQAAYRKKLSRLLAST